jgi:hypothetical protein
MGKETNYLLEFTFDTLLNVFNYERVPFMKKYYFCKLMNLVDTRLLKQGVDIGYPEFWYMYGPITDFAIVDGIIDHGFTNRYYPDNENVIYPAQHRRNYDIDLKDRRIIESTIQTIWSKYRFETGDNIKAENYKQNSPYKFNTTFQDFIRVVDNDNQTSTPKEVLISNLLDKLLSEFPQNDLSEIEDFYLEWDDTIRLVLDLKDSKRKMELVKVLKGKFWSTFSKGIRLRVNKNIPDEKLAMWSEEYQKAITQQYKDVERIREAIILEDSEINIEPDEYIVKSLMQTAYHIGI